MLVVVVAVLRPGSLIGPDVTYRYTPTPSLLKAPGDRMNSLP